MCPHQRRSTSPCDHGDDITSAVLWWETQSTLLCFYPFLLFLYQQNNINYAVMMAAVTLVCL